MPDIPAEFWDTFRRRLYSNTAQVMLDIYLAGGKTGILQLPERARGLLSWDVFNRAAVEYLRRYRLNTVSDIEEVTRRNALRVIADWVEAGEPLDMLVSRLNPWFGADRAKRIAVTEVTRTYAAGNIASWEATRVVGEKVWQTARDEKVCPVCGPLHGQVVSLGGNFQIDQNQLPKGLAGSGAEFNYFQPPAHVNCVLPDNHVLSPGGISAAAKSFYDGRCVEISTEGGRVLTVTENHPVLTSYGWVSAKFINDGAYLFATKDIEGIAASIHPYDNQREARIEDVFSSIKKTPTVLSVTVPATAEDFHSDGRAIEGDISVVKPYGFLLDDVKTTSPHEVRKGSFNGGDVAFPSLLTDCLGNLFLNRFFLSLQCGMGGSDLGATLGVRHALPLQPFGVGLTPDWDTGFDYALMKSPAIDTQLAADFVFRFPSQITLDKVVKVRYFHYSGHVYDLQNDLYELYTVNSIITHNCRCWLKPVVSLERVGDEIERVLNAD